jgi:hypothetical protein
MMRVAQSVENLIPYKQVLERRAPPVEMRGVAGREQPSERTEFEWCYNESNRTALSNGK